MTTSSIWEKTKKVHEMLKQTHTTVERKGDRSIDLRTARLNALRSLRRDAATTRILVGVIIRADARSLVSGNGKRQKKNDIRGRGVRSKRRRIRQERSNSHTELTPLRGGRFNGASLMYRAASDLQSDPPRFAAAAAAGSCRRRRF